MALHKTDMAMELCGVCAALNAAAAVVGAGHNHIAICVALIVLGYAHGRRWVFATNGSMVAMVSLGAWVATTGPTPEGVEMLGSIATGASAAWYIAAALTPTARFVMYHIVGGCILAAAAQRSEIDEYWPDASHVTAAYLAKLRSYILK